MFQQNKVPKKTNSARQLRRRILHGTMKLSLFNEISKNDKSRQESEFAVYQERGVVKVMS